MSGAIDVFKNARSQAFAVRVPLLNYLLDHCPLWMNLKIVSSCKMLAQHAKPRTVKIIKDVELADENEVVFDQEESFLSFNPTSTSAKEFGPLVSIESFMIRMKLDLSILSIQFVSFAKELVIKAPIAFKILKMLVCFVVPKRVNLEQVLDDQNNLIALENVMKLILNVPKVTISHVNLTPETSKHLKEAKLKFKSYSQSVLIMRSQMCELNIIFSNRGKAKKFISSLE